MSNTFKLFLDACEHCGRSENINLAHIAHGQPVHFYVGNTLLDVVTLLEREDSTFHSSFPSNVGRVGLIKLALEKGYTFEKQSDDKVKTLCFGHMSVDCRSDINIKDAEGFFNVRVTETKPGHVHAYAVNYPLSYITAENMTKYLLDQINKSKEESIEQQPE